MNSNMMRNRGGGGGGGGGPPGPTSSSSGGSSASTTSGGGGYPSQQFGSPRPPPPPHPPAGGTQQQQQRRTGAGAGSSVSSSGPMSPHMTQRRPSPVPVNGGSYFQQQQGNSSFNNSFNNSMSSIGSNAGAGGTGSAAAAAPSGYGGGGGGGYSYAAPTPSQSYTSATAAAGPAPTAATTSSSKGSYGGYRPVTNNNYQSYGGGYGGSGSGASTNPSAGQDYAFAAAAAAAGAGAYNSRGGAGGDDKYSKKKPKRAGGGGGSDGGMDAGYIILLVLAGLFFLWAVSTTVLWSNASSSTKHLLDYTQHDSIKDLQDSYQKLKSDLRLAERSAQKATQTAVQKSQQTTNALERQNRLLTKERDELIQKAEKDKPSRQALMSKVHSREKAYKNQVNWLTKMARRESKREILERFGPGPHKVELTFAIPTGEVDDGESTEQDSSPTKMPVPAVTQQLYSFVIDMAPIELVPHAVHLFLEQVDHGLLNGTYFYLNGPHILQSGPQFVEEDEEELERYLAEEEEAAKKKKEKKKKKKKKERSDGDEEDDEEDDDDDEDEEEDDDDEEYKRENVRLRKFAALGLEKLAFPDYSDEFPHQPWTLGFTGRPGGPDWYINKVDNSKGHGPGGQKQHALDEQGDSCFAIVSEEGNGRERLASLVYGRKIWGDRSSWHYFLEEPIEIVGAKVLTKLPSVHKLHMDAAKYNPEKYTTTSSSAANQQTSDATSDGTSHKPIGDVLDKAVQDLAMDPLHDPDAVVDTIGGDGGAGAGEDGTSAAAAAMAAASAAAQQQNAENDAAATEQMMEDAEYHGNIDLSAKKFKDKYRNHHPKPKHMPKIKGQVDA